ncbi:GGDEF domain-containing protein [Gimibacter soli]|uniref:diguanylate cyclase n=1 Tax=Gimibacter soli TaxID=3024400 RepID=A0AAF0BIR7_9PROT|nr:GGDEF domain-containing protein [Gimibacter soli]WCL55723.1 GGDEF domain-containing protein [Gimibacter soli]
MMPQRAALEQTDVPGRLIDIDALPWPVLISDADGLAVVANAAMTAVIGMDAAGLPILEAFAPLHAETSDPTIPNEIVATLIAAPGMPYSDKLHLTDGRLLERASHPIAGDRRIWTIFDRTIDMLAQQDGAMHASLMEDETARVTELADQLYLAKQELETQQTELTRLATTDPMTGLLNRRSFADCGRWTLEDAQAGGNLVAIMVDIDHFKAINDTFGHAAGDIAICYCARRITELLPDGAISGRMGGEEFAVLLPGHSAADALPLAEKIRLAMRAPKKGADIETPYFTVSIGVAEFGQYDQSLDFLIGRADRALYKAKESGRNRVELDNEQTD